MSLKLEIQLNKEELTDDLSYSYKSHGSLGSHMRSSAKSLYLRFNNIKK